MRAKRGLSLQQKMPLVRRAPGVQNNSIYTREYKETKNVFYGLKKYINKKKSSFNVVCPDNNHSTNKIWGSTWSFYIIFYIYMK